MKNLAHCSLKEFLRQTNKIRKAVKKWMDLTDAVKIRSRLPEVAADATDEIRRALIEKQGLDNLNALLEAALEKYPDETAEVIGLCCFIEPEDLDDYRVSDLLGSAAEMISCPEVVDFFTSLARLGTMRTSGAAKG